MPAYTELYDSAGIDIPVRGDWTRHPPFRVGAIAGKAASMRQATAREIIAVRHASYSQLTHLDRQMRIILGTLRGQGTTGKHHHRFHQRPRRHAVTTACGPKA
jgi:hypothetical protein